APQAAARVIRRFHDERTAGEAFRSWMDRVGGALEIAKGLKDLDVFPKPEDAPEFYVDYGEQGPFVADVGESECAV
ncbi:MAG: nitrite/sulfite reductase, partial [Actinomycetota bacterium]